MAEAAKRSAMAVCMAARSAAISRQEARSASCASMAEAMALGSSGHSEPSEVSVTMSDCPPCEVVTARAPQAMPSISVPGSVSCREVESTMSARLYSNGNISMPTRPRARCGIRSSSKA